MFIQPFMRTIIRTPVNHNNFIRNRYAFLNILIFVMNILDFFLFRFKIFRELQQYTPFLMSLMLVLVSKLMENGLHYFGSNELAEKWRNIGIIIFYGFSIPFYTFVSFNVCGFIAYDVFQFSPKILILFLPFMLCFYHSVSCKKFKKENNNYNNLCLLNYCLLPEA